jgi:hypothetical protein
MEKVLLFLGYPLSSPKWLRGATSNRETVTGVRWARVQALHVTKKLYAKSELSAKIEV